MIYLPRRGVFLHIPRTAGNSVTSGIAGATAGRGIDCLVCTSAKEHQVCTGLYRHVPAFELKPLIAEWDNIYKFCIDRDVDARVDSVCRLIARDIRNGVHDDPTCPESWRDLLLNPNHRDIVTAQQKALTTDWYTLSPQGENMGIERIPYAELNDRWPEICDKLQIPRCELPHLNQA